MQLKSAALAGAVLFLSVSAVAATTTARPQMTNTGETRAAVFTGHVLTPPQLKLTPSDRILYAPAGADDPTFRAAVSTAAGGATVDYFDARVGTPSPALLATYDAVFTWVNYAYANNVVFGNVLSSFCDNGGNVVLGPFCTYTSGNFLSGRIMGTGYSPVKSPAGTNHFSLSTYVGDGTTILYTNVTTLSGYYRDYLTLLGAGVKDGTYADGEICMAYNKSAAPAGGYIVYLNGCSASPLLDPGDWAIAVANAALATTIGCTQPSQYGSGCPGSGGFTPTFNMTGCPTPGGSLNIIISQGLGGSNAFLFLGAFQAAIPMGAGCTMNVSPIFGPFGPLPLSAGGPGAGAINSVVAIPPGSPLGTVVVQAFVVDGGAPLGYSNSNGVTLTIQ
ncbi:MAG: hypothetical protein HY812_03045 [Planctomycetes bacterium]|nr:hypothetical protein [Planctomycetota bacterium]